MLKSIPAKAFVVLLCDERGKDLSSLELAGKYAAWQELPGSCAFIIGSADGVTDEGPKRVPISYLC